MNQPFTAARLMFRAVHRGTAYFLLTFLLLHIGHHMTGVLGVEAYNDLQKSLRLIYRHPIIEPILFFAVGLQLLVGLALVVKSVRQERPKGFWSWIQILSGITIFLTVGEHMLALYLARVIDGLDTTLYWPLSVMNGAPFVYYFAPYYFLMVASVFIHAAAGLHYIGLDRGYGSHVDVIAKFLIMTGVLVAGFIVMILSQLFFDISLPEEWLDYLRQFSPNYGVTS